MKNVTYGMLGWCLLTGILAAQKPQYPDYPSETPAKFVASTGGLRLHASAT